MQIIWYLLAALYLIDAVRCRKLLQRIPVCSSPAGQGGVHGCADYEFLIAPGVEINEAARQAAVEFAQRADADLVDCLPAGMPAMAAVEAIQLLGFHQARQDRMERGWTAGSALLVRRKILTRAQIKVNGAVSVTELAQAAVKLTRYAANGLETLILPGATAAKKNPRRQWKAYRTLFGAKSGPMLLIGGAVVMLTWAGLFIAPVAGLAALVTMHAQPLIILAGNRLRTRQLALTTLLRTPWMLLNMARLAAGSLDHRERLARIAAERPTYGRLLTAGQGSFFHDRSLQCVLCGSTRLILHLKTPDLFQRKPGQFRLERCSDCGHIFQNPQLTAKGLEYYYRDFYDGLGKEEAEDFFACGVNNQKDQLATVAEFCRPTHWLDVGAGHGHLCRIAKSCFPDTRFEGLDLSESIEEGERCNWVAKAHRGTLPALAAKANGEFDLVTMFHYLEHTTDQRTELAAAFAVLSPGGHLVIEVPDPECVFGKLLGKYWLPWFQPQHLHLIKASNVERLLREAGFDPVSSKKVAGSQYVSLLLSASLVIRHLAPNPDVPWLPPASVFARLRFFAGQVAAPPLLFAGFVGDCIAGRLMAPFGTAAAYRVVAKRP